MIWFNGVAGSNKIKDGKKKVRVLFQMGFLTLREVKNKNLISVLDGSFSITNTYQRDFITVISIALVCFSMSEEIGKELKVNEK